MSELEGLQRLTSTGGGGMSWLKCHVAQSNIFFPQALSLLS